jgi:hypothetical protein
MRQVMVAVGPLRMDAPLQSSKAWEDFECFNDVGFCLEGIWPIGTPRRTSLLACSLTAY